MHYEYEVVLIEQDPQSCFSLVMLEDLNTHESVCLSLPDYISKDMMVGGTIESTVQIDD